MRRIVFLWIGICLMGLPTAHSQGNVQQKMDNAIQYFKNGDYKSAIDRYEELLSSGFHSEALYYNLGNAYYRNDQLGKAILHYERALLLDPNDADILHNLEVARQQQIDDIAVIPEFFLFRWWKNAMLSVGSTGWSIIGLLLLWVGIAGLVIWLVGKTRKRRKQGFLLGSTLLILCILPFALAFSAKAYIAKSEVAFLTQSEAPLYSAPDTLSQELRMLHDGTKLQLIDSLSQWYKVQLTNGDEGWMEMSVLEEL